MMEGKDISEDTCKAIAEYVLANKDIKIEKVKSY